MTIRFNQLVETIHKAYADFEFLTIYKAIVNFVTVDLSAFIWTLPKVSSISKQKLNHWNVVKCRLFSNYILSQDYQAVDADSCHTQQVKKSWSYLEHEEEEFVQLSELPEAQTFPNQEEILDTWSAFLWTSRSQAQKALEEARKMRRLSENLEAHLTVYLNEVIKTLLEAVNSDVAQLSSFLN